MNTLLLQPSLFNLDTFCVKPRFLIHKNKISFEAFLIKGIVEVYFSNKQSHLFYEKVKLFHKKRYKCFF